MSAPTPSDLFRAIDDLRHRIGQLDAQALAIAELERRLHDLEQRVLPPRLPGSHTKHCEAYVGGLCRCRT